MMRITKRADFVPRATQMDQIVRVMDVPFSITLCRGQFGGEVKMETQWRGGNAHVQLPRRDGILFEHLQQRVHRIRRLEGRPAVSVAYRIAPKAYTLAGLRSRWMTPGW